MNKTLTKRKVGSWYSRAGGHNAKMTYKSNRHDRDNNNETSQKKMQKKQPRDETEEPPWDGQK